MNFAAPENVELCLDKVLQNMGLDHVDLWLAHFPLAFKPTSPEGLAKATAGPTKTNEALGILEDPTTKSLAIDWEHCSSPIAAKSGKSFTHYCFCLPYSLL
jgi:glycerol 2-dehydrogenase (NADP+)